MLGTSSLELLTLLVRPYGLISGVFPRLYQAGNRARDFRAASILAPDHPLSDVALIVTIHRVVGTGKRRAAPVFNPTRNVADAAQSEDLLAIVTVTNRRRNASKLI